jgi:hypothetical protein
MVSRVAPYVMFLSEPPLAVALCSGLMDEVRGHTLHIHCDFTFPDNPTCRYNERERYGL